MLKLSLQKGTTLQLNLKKGSKFTVGMSWTSDHDPDAHALLLRAGPAGSRLTDLSQVLSTHNCKKTNPRDGTLAGNPDGSFNTPCGSLHHSGDARNGLAPGVCELITVDPSKISADIDEIPFFVTVYVKPGQKPVSFSEIKDCVITIKDDEDKVLGQYQLTDEFGKFNAVQMGSLMRNGDTWEYSPIGSGFQGDFNTILGSF